MRGPWAFLACAAFLQAANCDLVDDVKKTIDDFKAMMPTGDAALGIPQLEPLSISELPLNVHVTPFNAKIVAKNILVSGASGFDVKTLSLRDDGKLSLSLEMPSIKVTGEYIIDGKVKVGFMSVTLAGSGPLELNAGGIDGDGVAEVVKKANGGLHVSDLQITSWNFKNLKVQLSNLFGGGVMGKTVNALINKIIPVFIESNKIKINQIVQSKAQNYINKYLDGLSSDKSILKDDTTVAMDWIISPEMQDIIQLLAEAVVSAQVADGSNETPSALEEQTAKLLENFRAMMKEGRPDFNIPKLDPAVVEKLAIDVKHTLFNAKIIATDATIQGVSEFSVANITQLDGTNKVTVELVVPFVKIDSKFEMHGKVSIPFAPAINDNGPLQLNITDLKLSATADILAEDDGSYNIKSITMDSWSFANIKIQLDNLLGGGVFGKEANKIFNRIFPALVENDRSKINKRLEAVMKNLLNAYLDGLAGKTSADLSAKLQEISELFRTAMKTGRADINIPVMDPAAVDELSVQFKKWPIVANIGLSKIAVTGASEYRLSKVSQIVGTNKVSIDFEIPALSATGAYDLRSTVHAAFIKFNANRKGEMQTEIQGLAGTAIAELSIESDDQLSLLNLEVESMTYKSIKVEVDHLATGGFFKKTLHKLINKLFPAVFIQPHMAEVGEWASRAGQHTIGKFIDALAGRVVLPNLDVRAADLLDQLKVVMKTGSDKYNMPVYDPASVDEVNLEVNLRLLGKAKLVVSDTSVQGTSEFVVSKISQTPGTNKLDIIFTVPILNARCKFLATLLKLKDSGSATATFSNLTVAVTAALSSDVKGSLVLRDIQIRSWSVGKIAAAFENLDELGIVGKALSKTINTFLPTVIEAKKAAITEWAETKSKLVVEEFLAGVAAQSAADTARSQQVGAAQAA